MKQKQKNIIFIISFSIGLSVLLYPLIANMWNSYRQSRLISNYTEQMEEASESGEIDFDVQWAMAEQYNERLKPMILPDSFAKEFASDRDEAYMACLNVNGDGIMGLIEIPKIDVTLPIYHTTEAEVLELGAGHLEGSSLPIGSKSGHAVISAHRGLPSASLFTDLDKLKKKDHFLIRVLDEILCYEVDKISVVEPEDTDLLAMEEGKDLVTLLTCTPYGVNSKRLLVRGHRVPYVPEEVEDEKANSLLGVSIFTNYLFWVLLGLAITAGFAALMWRKNIIQKVKGRLNDRK